MNSNIITTGAVATHTNVAATAIAYSYENRGTDDLVEFVEFALEIMGHNIKFSEFKNMSADEKKSMLRDIRIRSVFNEKM